MPATAQRHRTERGARRSRTSWLPHEEELQLRLVACCCQPFLMERSSVWGRSERYQKAPLMAGICSMRQTSWGRRKAVLGQKEEEAPWSVVPRSLRASPSMCKEGDRAIHIARRAENGAAARGAIFREAELLSKRSMPSRMHIALEEPLRAGESYTTNDGGQSARSMRRRALAG